MDMQHVRLNDRYVTPRFFSQFSTLILRLWLSTFISWGSCHRESIMPLWDISMLVLPPSIAPGTDPTWQHTLMCVARFFWVLKALAQAGQVCPLSLECTEDRCLCRSVRSLKCFKQYTHCISFFLKWMVFSCRSALDLRVKLAGHWEQR